jgi:hypothetical protein
MVQYDFPNRIEEPVSSPRGQARSFEDKLNGTWQTSISASKTGIESSQSTGDDSGELTVAWTHFIEHTHFISAYKKHTSFRFERFRMGVHTVGTLILPY